MEGRLLVAGVVTLARGGRSHFMLCTEDLISIDHRVGHRTETETCGASFDCRRRKR